LFYLVEKVGEKFIKYKGTDAAVIWPKGIIFVDVSKPLVFENLYLEFVTLGLITYQLPVLIEVNEL